MLAAQRSIDAGHSKLDSTTKKSGGVFSSTFGSIMPLAAAAAGAAVLKFGKDSIDAFHESEAAMAQTQAVLKSTGGAANVTAQDVVNLAEKLRDLSGADDEAIQSSENLLLTFTRVRNEAGAGNDIFNQTTGAILDMATSMNNGAIPSLEDLNSKTILVGKAMNDPIRGLTALTRVGVTFSDGQRESIEAMVAAGDTMGAQKIILAELTKEFGGSAKAAGDTFAGAQAKAAQKIEDLQEKIGGILVPILADLGEQFAELLTDITPIIEIVGKGVTVAFEAATEKVEALIAPLQFVLDLLPSVGGEVEESAGLWKLWGDAVGNAVQSLIEQRVPGSQTLFALRDASDEATGSWQTQTGVVGDLSSAFRGEFAEAMDTAHEKQTVNTNASRALTDAMRDQRLAVLALTDSYLGILDSATDVQEAQRELNRLERQGKEDTKAYEQAVLDALEAQGGLEAAVLTYAKELKESGETSKAVKEKVRELAEGFGVQDGVVRELVARVQAYLDKLNAIPSSVHTTLGVTTPSEVRPHLQHGGIVTRPTMALIGEAGPEAVIPLSRGRGGGGLAETHIHFHGGTFVGTSPEELASLLADPIRREFVRTGRRNGDIFGGRA